MVVLFSSLAIGEKFWFFAAEQGTALRKVQWTPSHGTMYNAQAVDKRGRPLKGRGVRPLFKVPDDHSVWQPNKE